MRFRNVKFVSPTEKATPKKSLVNTPTTSIPSLHTLQAHQLVITQTINRSYLELAAVLNKVFLFNLPVRQVTDVSTRALTLWQRNLRRSMLITGLPMNRTTMTAALLVLTLLFIQFVLQFFLCFLLSIKLVVLIILIK